MIDCDRRRWCRSRAMMTGCPLATTVVRRRVTLSWQRTMRIF
jgi:hypothetical protein